MYGVSSCLLPVCVGSIPSCPLPVCVGCTPSCLLPVCMRSGCIPSFLPLYMWGVCLAACCLYVWGVYLAAYCLYVWGLFLAAYCLDVWGVYLAAYCLYVWGGYIWCVYLYMLQLRVYMYILETSCCACDRGGGAIFREFFNHILLLCLCMYSV
jgi:hypothetical protein